MHCKRNNILELANTCMYKFDNQKIPRNFINDFGTKTSWLNVSHTHENLQTGGYNVTSTIQFRIKSL